MDLPSEIFTNILSRLPVLAIVRLKCVCKTWLQLLDSPEFANHHLSKSSPGILVHQQQWDSSLFDFSGFEDELGDQVQCHGLHCIPVAKFDIIKVLFHGCPTIVGSVDGFLCLRSRRPFDDLYIFNLMKREYISLPAPQRETAFPFTVSHGFGVSTNGGQYKLVLIFQESEPQGSIPRCDSHVYTLGTTGKWRCIAPITPLNYCCYTIGASLNGNLHWLAGDVEDSRVISFLDLDKEVFGTFSAPPLPGYRSKCLASLVALGDRLCVCDNTCENDIVVWIMKDYGGDESWTREFVISKMPNLAGTCLDVVSPIKVFKNGDILMKWGDYYLVCYSNRNKTISRIDGIQRDNCWGIEAVLHVPALVSLACFAGESVNSF